MAWYNKYRPKNFDEVIGQSLVKSVLQNAIIHNRIKHAYLFAGPKGVGKTTLARIFANQLNDTVNNPESLLDIVEMDAASHTGIDDIRLLIESAKTQPIAGKYKIFIIDEVHMLSKSAMNALLKILEEPPHYLIFLLATTNEEKLLPTVLSRLTRLQLTNHSEKDIVARLTYIASNEKVNIDEEALKIVAKRSGGSQRDAINLLETIASYGLETYNADNTSELLGLLPVELLQKTAENLLYNDLLELQLLEQIEARGIDAQGYLSQLLEFLLDQSFAGNKEFDRLILPVAEVISLQLPLTSPISVLSIIKVKMESQTSQSTELLEKKSPETSKTPKIALTKTSSINSVSSVNLLSQTIAEKKDELKNNESESSQIALEQTQENNQPTQSQKVIKNTSLDPQSLAKFIQEIPYFPEAKPSLKMIAKDLKAELRGQQLVLITSKEVFQGQLKSKEVQDWISAQFETIFGFRPTIVLELRENETFLSPTNLKHNLDDLTTSPNINDSISTRRPDSTLRTTIASNQNSKYFYKIYNQPPEGLTEPVEVIKGPLPLPKKVDVDWDNHTKELFEFE